LAEQVDAGATRWGGKMIAGLDAWVFWLILMIIFLTIEAATFNLTAVWFAGGCLAALILDLLGTSEYAQMIVMVVLSALLLLLYLLVLKPRLNHGGSSISATNADRFIGRDALVIEPVDPSAGTGLIKAMGQVWSAVSEDGRPVARGILTTIVAIQGVKVIIKAKDTEQTDKEV
jgi:membrane protein implicated in regulation of membrane protease activity